MKKRDTDTVLGKTYTKLPSSIDLSENTSIAQRMQLVDNDLKISTFVNDYNNLSEWKNSPNISCERISSRYPPRPSSLKNFNSNNELFQSSNLSIDSNARSLPEYADASRRTLENFNHFEAPIKPKSKNSSLGCLSNLLKFERPSHGRKLNLFGKETRNITSGFEIKNESNIGCLSKISCIFKRKPSSKTCVYSVPKATMARQNPRDSIASNQSSLNFEHNSNDSSRPNSNSFGKLVDFFKGK